jgi:hypothetical protein
MLGPCLKLRLARIVTALDPVGVEPQPLVSREELAAVFFAVHDILEEVREITRLLRDDDGEEAEEPED